MTSRDFPVPTSLPSVGLGAPYLPSPATSRMSPGAPGAAQAGTQTHGSEHMGVRPITPSPIAPHSSPLSWRTSPAELQVWGLARPPRPLAPLGCPSRARNPLPVGRSSPWQPSGLVWVCAHGSGLCWGAVWGTQGSAPTPVWLRGLFAHLPYRHQGPRKGSEGCGQRWVQGLSRALPLPQHPPQAPDWNKELQKPLSAPGSTRRAGGGVSLRVPQGLVDIGRTRCASPASRTSPGSFRAVTLRVSLRFPQPQNPGPRSPTLPGGAAGLCPEAAPTACPCAAPRPRLSPALPSVHKQRRGTWYPFIYKQIKVK